MNYKITKIEREINRFVVEAEFYDKDKKVETINHAFPLEMTEEEVEMRLLNLVNFSVRKRLSN